MIGIVVYLMAVALLRVLRRKPAPKPRGLCAGCAFAHIQYGANAKIVTFCTFGGGVRPVALDVLYCTDYRDRNAPARVVTTIGFAPSAQDVEAAAALAP
jgi:hypothetical protein